MTAHALPAIRIAVLMPDYRADVDSGGGLCAVADYLLGRIATQPGLSADLVAATTSSSDATSRRASYPRSLFRRTLYSTRQIGSQEVHHFGGNLVEFEPMRYRSRRELTKFLQQYDVIQVVAGSPAFALIARLVNRPTLLQVASFVDWERTSLLASSHGWRRLMRSIMTRAVSRLDDRALDSVDEIFVENDTMLREVRKRSSTRVSLAPPGVDTSVFQPSTREGPGRASFVLSVGRFDDPRKDTAALFRSFALLRQRVPSSLRLVLAGRTRPRDSDWNLANELGISAFVDVISPVSQDELVRLYQRCSCFALTSSEEGLGIVILEALACGAPVVATRTAGASYILKGSAAGILCELGVGVEERLARSYERVLTEPGLADRLSELGRKLVLSRFSLEVAAMPFIDGYYRLAARPSVVRRRRRSITSPRDPDPPPT